MDLVALCPLRVAARPFQPARNSHALLVVCKATYRLVPGTSALHETQEDPCEEDNHWDDNPQRSLYASSDFAPFKRGADVVLVGHAFAPNGTPVRSFLTRLCVAELDKSIEVFGDRLYTPHGELREGQRVARVRLRWERAAGGPGTNNPVGMRHDMKDSFGSIALPSFQPPGRHVTRPEDLVEPIGYGPIAPSWPSRQSRLGALARIFSPSHWHAAPLPEGLDPSFFNVAPPDQEVHELRADERIVLEGLHPDHARLVTNLPGLRPRAVIERATGQREALELVADTLWIDTTRGLCTMVWRGRVALSHPAEAGRVVVTMVDASGAHAELLETPISPDDPDGSVTSVVDSRLLDKPRAVMPFSMDRPFTPPPRESGVYPTEPSFMDEETTYVGPDLPVPNPLPFRATPSSPLPFTQRSAEPPKPPPTSNGLPFAAPTNPSPPLRDLPFATPWSQQAAPPAPPTPFQPPPQPPAPQVFPKPDLPFVSPNPPPVAPPVVPPAMVSPPRPPSPSLAAAPVAPPAMVPPPLNVLGRHAAPPFTPTPTPVSAPAPAPAPASTPTQLEAPPLWGPLATPEMVARHAPPPPPAAEPEPPPPPPPPAAPEPAGPPPLPLDDYPIERCAKITASIARRREERAEILEAEELDLARWADLERHWSEAIQGEIERGKTKLLKIFDTNYVARLEEERGPITAAEFARLAVAGERGQSARMLAELGLPRGAMVRIERVFLARSVEDPSFGEKIRRAIEVERDA